MKINGPWPPAVPSSQDSVDIRLAQASPQVIAVASMGDKKHSGHAKFKEISHFFQYQEMGDSKSS